MKISYIFNNLYFKVIVIFGVTSLLHYILHDFAEYFSTFHFFFTKTLIGTVVALIVTVYLGIILGLKICSVLYKIAQKGKNK